MKKIFALLLALCLTFVCLSGCGSAEIRSYSADGTTSSSATRDTSGAYAAYDPETAVMTVGGDKITWKEYFYWLNSCILSLDSANKGQIEDWDADCAQKTGTTNAQYVKDSVKGAIVQYHIMNAKAKELGVTLTDADKTKMKETLASDIKTYCGDDATEEDFSKYLDTLYMSRDYYDYVNQTSMLYYDVFIKLYGENGEKCTDEETKAFAEDNNYMTANHILLSTVDSEGNALSDAEIAKKKEQAQKLSDELQKITDQTQLVKKFKELRDEYTEDTGAANYPNGYCFTEGQMVDEFETACKALKEYEVSEPVESQYGYHVILRLPTTPEDEVTYVSEGKYQTLRYYAAVDRYNSVVSNWISDAAITWEGKFEKLDIAKLLKK